MDEHATSCGEHMRDSAKSTFVKQRVVLTRGHSSWGTFFIALVIIGSFNVNELDLCAVEVFIRQDMCGTSLCLWTAVSISLESSELGQFYCYAVYKQQVIFILYHWSWPAVFSPKEICHINFNLLIYRMPLFLIICMARKLTEIIFSTFSYHLLQLIP